MEENDEETAKEIISEVKALSKEIDLSLIHIYKKYGASSVDTVKNNPYILCDEISGIGFKTSDKIARSLGIEIDSPFRIQRDVYKRQIQRMQLLYFQKMYLI